MSLNLLILDIRWPPESFLQRKLSGLVGQGINVRVAASIPRGRPIYRIPGVQLARLPRWDDPFLYRLAMFCIYGVKFLFSPRGGVRRLKGLLACLADQPIKSKFNRLLKALVVLPLEAEVVHFEWVSAAGEYLPVLEGCGRPYTVSCRGRQVNILPYLPENSAYVQKLRRTFTGAAAIHCVSGDILEQARRYGAEPEKAWIIRPAVDPDFFSPRPSRPPPRSEYRIVTTGALLWRKGHEYALAALRRLIDLGCPARFEIIGSGPERQRLLYAIQDLGLEGAVQLCGQLPPAEVHHHLHNADVFLLSSLSEGISNAALEAMACGLPVVTTDCGGMREAIEDGVEGLVVPVRDPQAIAESLHRLWKNPGERERMGQAARSRILADFRLEQQIEQFVQMYQSVV